MLYQLGSVLLMVEKVYYGEWIIHLVVLRTNHYDSYKQLQIVIRWFFFNNFFRQNSFLRFYIFCFDITHLFTLGK